ncbi:MAG: 4Fe-4S ferredoxin iron-sulfur binding domain protein [Deltaproteobacteria bacterium]|nr:4Fe-4S ferredoxin iron-sulfur binding domain protein [Deltaproteobacteria bacterium]
MSDIEQKAYAVPNLPGPGRPVLFNPDICNGCNRCVEICPMEVFIPNPEKGKPPIILYPEECWYGGCCVEECPRAGAITFNHPLMQRVRWKRKDTGEHFRT